MEIISPDLLVPLTVLVAVTVFSGMIAVHEMGLQDGPGTFLLCLIPGLVCAMIARGMIYIYHSTDWAGVFDIMFLLLKILVCVAVLLVFWAIGAWLIQEKQGVRVIENPVPNRGFQQPYVPPQGWRGMQGGHQRIENDAPVPPFNPQQGVRPIINPQAGNIFGNQENGDQVPRNPNPN